MADRPPNTGFAGLASLGVDVGDALGSTPGSSGPQGQAAQAAVPPPDQPATAQPRVRPYQGTQSKRGAGKLMSRGTIAVLVGFAVLAIFVVIGIVTEDNTTETLPPVATNQTLSRAEIRYCIAEEIRLQGAQGAIDRRKGDDIRRFNAMVDDYNSRCSSFRYRSGTLESARRDVEPNRDRLRQDGAARLGR